MNKTTPSTIDLLLGFDSQQLQGEMTRGLADWHRRRHEAALDRRFIGVTLGLSLLMVSCAYSVAPTADYRLGKGVDYDKVVAINNTLLGR